MGLIRLLAVVLGAILLLRLFTRFVGPWLGRYFVKKATDKMQEQMKTRQQGEKVFEEGEVTIRKSDQKGGKSSGEAGEYVDYEEV